VDEEIIDEKQITSDKQFQAVCRLFGFRRRFVVTFFLERVSR